MSSPADRKQSRFRATAWARVSAALAAPCGGDPPAVSRKFLQSAGEDAPGIAVAISPGVTQRTPIVLLHGFAGWSRGLLPLEHHLRRALDREVVRLPLGPGLDGIDAVAARAALAIERIGAQQRGKIEVVGHSMGGLVATYVLKHLDRGARIGRVIALGSPFRGAPLARAGLAVLGWLGPSLAQMIPGCRFLADLERAASPDGVGLVSVAGLSDLIVPAPCARLPRRARHHNRTLPEIDHWGLLNHASAHAAVERELRRPLRAAHAEPTSLYQPPALFRRSA